jgi:transcriptional regulator GlxA family with amidase domain
MRDHLADPLTLEQVARVAGFAPDYFSRLLKRDEGLSFEACLQRIRLERSKHLLTSTRMPVGQVSQLTGFKSRTHFQQVFKRNVGLTPVAYRESTAAGLALI